MSAKQKAYEAGQIAFWENKPNIPHNYDVTLLRHFMNGLSDAREQAEKGTLENEIDRILEKLGLERDEAKTLIGYFTGDLQQ